MGHGQVEDQSTRRRQTVSLLLRFLQDYLVLHHNIPRVTPFFTSLVLSMGLVGIFGSKLEVEQLGGYREFWSV
jgi:hypothetical protein